MNIRISRRDRGLGLIAAIIIMVMIVIIGGYFVAGILKLAKKLNDPPQGGSGLHYLSLSSDEQLMYESEPTLYVTDTVTGEKREFTQVVLDAVRMGVTNQIIVQRWFPDGRPEEYLYTTNINYYGDQGVEINDPNPPQDMAFYHIYVVSPKIPQ